MSNDEVGIAELDIPPIEQVMSRVKLRAETMPSQDISSLPTLDDPSATTPPSLLSNAQAQFLKSKYLRGEKKRTYPIYRVLQEWEGVVRSIESKQVVADLADVTVGETSLTERAVLDIDDLAPSDAMNLRVGAVFRWIIGYRTEPSGARARVSQVIFRQLPTISEADDLAARADMNKLNKEIEPLD